MIASLLLAFLCNLLLLDGKANAHPQPRPSARRQLIVGGQDAGRGRYPYFVSLDFNNGVVLSGALIAPDFVLTAGHCLENDREHMTVRVGTYSLSHDINNTDFDIVHVGSAILHPGFDRFQPEYFSHDFSLFHLNDTSSHPVVKLNRDSAVPDPLEDTVTIMGMGWTTLAYQSPADTLQVANLTAISNEECNLSQDPARANLAYEGFIDATMLCTIAVPNNTRDGCAWDSGAPLIVPGRHNDPARDVLVGLGMYAYQWNKNTAF